MGMDSWKDFLVSMRFWCNGVLPKAGDGVLALKAEGRALTVALWQCLGV